MTDICGSVEELLPRTYYWNLERKPWYLNSSGNFTIVSTRVDKYKLSLHLSDYDSDTGSAYLEMSCRERFLLYLDVKVNLHYANNSEFEFSRYDFYVWTEKHKLRIVNVKGLLGITCRISDIRVRFKGSDESDGNASKDAPIESSQHLSPIQDKESKSETDEPVKTRDGNASKDAQIESSQNFSRIQAKESNSETDEPVKTRGLLALSGNLKDVFLDEEDSDVVLNVGNQKYPAHKIIIRARSPVFYAMLKHDMKEKRQGSVDIADCDPHIFKDFLLYLYTGKLDNISNENVFELYHMSDKYEVNELKMDCTDYIFSNLSVDIICDVISLATKHCERDLLTHATKFFTENAKEILLTVNWQTFVKENPVEANELFIKTFNKVSEK